MKYAYDLHIHSALSPCGDVDMTPNNIVNMSIIKGLDIIAVTDHNSCGNVRAVTEAADGRILVIPGMEVTTSEEVHVVCYFPTIENAEEMERRIKAKMPPIKNEPDIFGNQYYMDREDNICGEEEIFLVNACGMDIYEVFENAKELDGVAVLAHIDRTSYSVISNLGFIPPDLSVDAVEITSKSREKMEKEYGKYRILTSSDAHYLENISEPEFYLEISSKTTKDVIDFLCKRE